MDISYNRLALIHVLLFQIGAMGRECEMEKEAGFLLIVPQRSPTPLSWRATYNE